ncbi:hypothetical protein VTH06DRAFT_629 [Thermothelomyces fergusii]
MGQGLTMKPRSGPIFLSDRQDGRAAGRWEASCILIHETGHKKLDGSGFRLRFARGSRFRPGEASIKIEGLGLFALDFS